MNRQRLLLISISLFLLCSCKKFIQEQEEKAAMAIITNGQWYVQLYQRNDTNITASFSGYLFKFSNNSTVIGTKDSFSVAGTWNVDIPSKSIIADFPNAGPPVSNLNATWRITDSYNDSVVARNIDTANKITNILHLKKQ